MPLPFVKKREQAPDSVTHRAEAAAAVPEEVSWKNMRGQAPRDSNDLRRIVDLPRRPRPSDEEMAAWAQAVYAALGKGDVKCECETKYKRRCCKYLLPTQAWALYEGDLAGGLLGPIGVGHGKTLLDLLMSMVVESKRAVLLIPPNLKQQLLKTDWHFYGQHWHLPNLAGEGVQSYIPGRPYLYVIAFSELSGTKSSDLLHKLKPDTLIIDEAQSVRNRTAARTKRFLSYLKSHPSTKVFCWSGTLTSKSLKDYAHLSEHALRDKSPVPTHYPTVEEWAAHLDPLDVRTPVGALRILTADGKGHDARDGYSERLVQTLGVVSSGDNVSCNASLYINERKVENPNAVQEALKRFEELSATGVWQRPDGEELVDALAAARTARELSCGFFYRWRWPRGEKVEVIKSWLDARKEWHRELREKLKLGRMHMDSPLLCTKAAIRWYKGYVHIDKVETDNGWVEKSRRVIPPFTKSGPMPTWEAEHWPRWEQERDNARPETEAVWLSTFLVENALDWLAESPGIVWYEFGAFADKLLELAKQRGMQVTFAGPGKAADERVRTLEGTEHVIASIKAHGTGKNLQMFDRCLVTNPPSDGGTWEQLLGRTHRAGQTADEVSYEVYRHSESMRAAVERARELSQHIEGTFGSTQRLASVASWGF